MLMRMRGSFTVKMFMRVVMLNVFDITKQTFVSRKMGCIGITDLYAIELGKQEIWNDQDQEQHFFHCQDDNDYSLKIRVIY